jgi:hypothetical protein
LLGGLDPANRIEAIDEIRFYAHGISRRWETQNSDGAMKSREVICPTGRAYTSGDTLVRRANWYGKNRLT